MVDNAMQRGQAVEWLVKEKGDVLVVVAALLHGIMGHSLYIVDEEEGGGVAVDQPAAEACGVGVAGKLNAVLN